MTHNHGKRRFCFVKGQGNERTEAIKRAGALRLFGNLAIDVFSPFKPTMPKVGNPNTKLSAEVNAREAEHRKTDAGLRINRIKKAAAQKAASFNAYAARKGTLSQTVANLYLARTMQSASEAVAYVNLEKERADYMSTVKLLDAECL